MLSMGQNASIKNITYSIEKRKEKLRIQSYYFHAVG